MLCVSSKQFIEAMLTHLFNYIYNHFPFSLLRHFGKKNIIKKGFSVRVKNPVFLFHYLFMNCKGANFASACLITGAPWYGSFSLKMGVVCLIIHKLS